MSSSQSDLLPISAFPAPLHWRSAPAVAPSCDDTIPLSEIVSALCFALDLTEGAVPGHALRACLIGLRIGAALSFSPAHLSDLYYALLLKDIGCSSNSARMAQIFQGDERKAKAAVKFVDWTDSGLACGLWAIRHALPGGSILKKAAILAIMKRDGEQNNLAMFRARCERGATIARKTGLTEHAAKSIYSLDEHWNGLGYPDHLRGPDIPLLSRILLLAQHLDVYATRFGPGRAIREMHARSGRWFDPALVAVAEDLHRKGSLWAGCNTPEEREIVIALEPGEIRHVGPHEIDAICEAFADVVDAKSPMTFSHSVGVMHAANGISGRLRLNPERRQLVYRAALLHDLGKLRVPNSILDKPAALSPEEWTIVRQHPQLSGQIISRIASFQSIAVVAARHHERLDGSGYPDGLSSADLRIEDCIVAAADVFSTINEFRPYREALSPPEILTTLDRLKRQNKLNPECCDALQHELETNRDPEPVEEQFMCAPSSDAAPTPFQPSF